MTIVRYLNELAAIFLEPHLQCTVVHICTLCRSAEQEHPLLSNLNIACSRVQGVFHKFFYRYGEIQDHLT